MAGTEFSWLHLSDLHWNEKVSNAKWSTIKNELYNDLDRIHKKAGPFDVVIFSGDLTKFGSKEEFDKVTEFLEDLFKKSYCKDAHFLCVPGNHDLVRATDIDTNTNINNLGLWFTKDAIRKRFFDDTNYDLRKFIHNSFEHYFTFITYNTLPFAKNIQPGHLPGDFSATFEKCDYKFGFIGLNSAFLHLTDGANETNIAVDVEQIHKVCNKNIPAWCAANHVNFLITHHPPHWLTGGSDDNAVRKDFKSHIAPSGRFHAHLFGHMHDTNITLSSMGGGLIKRELQGVALSEIEKLPDGSTKRIHGYSAGKIIINKTDAQIYWWPRKLAEKKDGSYGIGRDCDFYLDEDGGYIKSDEFKININVIPKAKILYKANIVTSYDTHQVTYSTFLGRNELINNDLIPLLKDPKRRLITLWGPPGVGKTTIAQVLLEKAESLSLFKDGVYFCSFQDVVALDSFIATLNSTVAKSTNAKKDTLFEFLKERNCLLILDNFEDPLTSKDEDNVKDFITTLLPHAPNVKLVVTTRIRLNLPKTEDVIPVETLKREYSEKLLNKLVVAQKIAVDLKKGDLQALLDELGDIPLAIELAVPNLVSGVDDLTNELKNLNLGILGECGSDETSVDRNQSICKSISLSYSKIKNDTERLLFFVCSLFPSGLKRADADKIIHGLGLQTIKSLIDKSIVSYSAEKIFTMLAPIRTYAYGMFKKMAEIDDGVKNRWIDLCIEKSREYHNIKSGTAKKKPKDLINELPDMFRVLEYLVSKSEKDALIKILGNLTDFSHLVGITKDVMSFLDKTKEIAKKAGDILGQAKCIYWMGFIHLYESRNKEAMESYNQALPLYKQIGDILGQASCIFSIGDIHLYESRKGEAMDSYNQALSLYKQVGSILGQANCIFSIGDIHFSESRNDEAMESYNQALQMFKKFDNINILGQATCIWRIGDIHRYESRNDEAMKSYNQALQLFKDVGTISGEAHCIAGIGCCFINNNKTDEGIKKVFEAIKLYEKVSDRHSTGEAYKDLGNELEKIKGYEDKALEYRKKGEEILNSIERAIKD
ncbi:MAG: metallophosphoesterase [Nitrospirae bacterium]|nr:metallophosphoesterase [Nitrospirota bacterium]MBF0533557.1 metallophosphoesterase [Nitrospirota bacterium]MBF0615919.1 metallophosphoesterase [Nitrospirota bacterium]